MAETEQTLVRSTEDLTSKITETEAAKDELTVELQSAQLDREELQAAIDELNAQSLELNDALLVSKKTSEERRLQIVLMSNSRRSMQQSLTSLNKVLLERINQAEAMQAEIATLQAALAEAEVKLTDATAELLELQQAEPSITVTSEIAELCEIEETTGFDGLLACIEVLKPLGESDALTDDLVAE